MQVRLYGGVLISGCPDQRGTVIRRLPNFTFPAYYMYMYIADRVSSM